MQVFRNPQGSEYIIDAICQNKSDFAVKPGRDELASLNIDQVLSFL
jgi:hypothetical protein